ncbi:MAG: hypothetical protein QOI53_1216 [Verrucomicrobiota bacterium]|jgi:hypothetical protein|nr:hypothetical protein [Verrucomicrobiota bacterium]
MPGKRTLERARQAEQQGKAFSSGVDDSIRAKLQTGSESLEANPNTPTSHGQLFQKPFCAINRLVQFLNSMRMLRPLQRQRFICKSPTLANGVDEIGKSVLPIL